jgi:hypothetical protein
MVQPIYRRGIECDVLQRMQGGEHIELVTDECPEAPC